MSAAAATPPAPSRAKPLSPSELMEAMKSTRGFDPMPPDQHEWQQEEGEPPLYRLWSWMCGQTIRQGRRREFAVDEQGNPRRLKDAARDLRMDLPQVSKLWAWGEKKGLWHRNGGPELYLNGNVTASQVGEANRGRTVSCTDNLTKAQLLILQGRPKDEQERFRAVWGTAQEFRKAYLARKMAEGRDTCDGIDDNILRAFELPKTRLDKPEPEPVELPQLLLQFVQTTSVPPGVVVPTTETGCTEGEETGENLTVQEPASLLPSEQRQRSTLSVGQVSTITEETDRPTDSSEPPARAERETDSGTDPEPPPNLQQNSATSAPDDAELTRLADLIHAEFGRACPGQFASVKLCRGVRAALGETPLDYFRSALRVRVERAIRRHEATSLGLAEPLAREVAARWKADAHLRKPPPPPRAPDEYDLKLYRDTLADPRATEQEKQYAREFLEANAELVAQIDEAAGRKRMQ
jgi:hypothetical protein